jgi:hypothetical protein
MVAYKTQIIIFAIVAVIIFVLAPSLLNPRSAAIFNPQYKAQDINLNVAETSMHDINVSNDITSLSITGSVEGDGIATVYLLDSSGKKLRVYSGMQTQKPAGITGFGFVTSGANAPNYFRNVCEETCYFTSEYGPYSLYVELEPSTSIIINRIVYK